MKNKKIFVTREIPETGLALLRARGYEVDIYPKAGVPSLKVLTDYLKKKPYDAIITLLTDPVDAKLFDAVPTAKIFANYAVGFNNMNKEEAKKRGITLTNTPGNFSDCIAEHTLALMLALSTRIVEADRFMRAGKYKGWSAMNFIGIDLHGKTLGLIGAGHIGECVAHIAKRGFHMEVLYYDVKRNERLEKEHGALFIPSIEEVLQQSDVVSLHVPLFDSTHHLMNAKRFALMKKTAFLINTARGSVVNEKALVKALKNKQIAGAGLDVFEFEPKLALGLSKLPNVVLTPHIASARESARNEMSILACQNVISFLETGKAVNVVS